MVRGIHHINFIVRDLESAIPTWEQILGCRCHSRHRLERRGVDTARFRAGDAWIVLVQPTDPGAPADYLAAHGEGFFLLSFDVDSLDAESERLGPELLQGESRSGLDDWRVQDLDVERTCGAQLQLTAASTRS